MNCHLCVVISAMQLMLVMAWPASAQTGDPAALPAQPAGIIGAASGTGPWPAVAESRADLRTHTIYRPLDLPEGKLPLLVWGNGACRDNGLAYSSFLREISSHGYYVIALGFARVEREPQAGQPAPAAPVLIPGAGTQPAPRNTPDETTVSEMVQAMDWAATEARRPGGDLEDAIDLSKIAVAGHSCGGLQAIAASSDPRVTTSLIFDSGVYIRPGGRSGVQVGKEDLSRLHGPVAYFTGGPEDIAHENSLDDVDRIHHVPVFFAWLPVGHGGTFWSDADGGDWAVAAVRWLDWQLKGDQESGAWFIGTGCRFCGDPRWTVEQYVNIPGGVEPARVQQGE